MPLFVKGVSGNRFHLRCSNGKNLVNPRSCGKDERNRQRVTCRIWQEQKGRIKGGISVPWTKRTMSESRTWVRVKSRRHWSSFHWFPWLREKKKNHVDKHRELGRECVTCYLYPLETLAESRPWTTGRIGWLVSCKSTFFFFFFEFKIFHLFYFIF